jgi:tRNA U34 5-carboxymethylaminomethyl modifying GTPase MnmE/TrmE
VNLDDTIVAIATPAGRGGIGVVRPAGPLNFKIGVGLLGWQLPDIGFRIRQVMIGDQTANR